MPGRFFNCTVFLLLFFFSCNSVEPPPLEEKPILTLKLEDVSCAEAWITITTTNLSLPTAITLKQNDTVILNFNLNNSDTLFYIDSLLPNQTYTFQSLNQQVNQSEIKSNKLQVTTMDTTSHNFTWQTFTFGNTNNGSSILFDVAVIDENNIWAVGEIYTLDSLGNPDPTRFNAAVWSGNYWLIKRIPYYYQGQPFYNPIQSIFAFSENDIWFCGNGVIHWDGNNFVPISIPISVWGSYQMNKVWGTSSSDLYILGNAGNIAHYNGINWEKIESGTTTDINDVWGINNSVANSSLVLCTVSSRYHLGDYKLLSISGNAAYEYFHWPYTRLYGIWFNSQRNKLERDV